jgi:protein-L-isoaspartate(D-aspartate) O-methyltransferase
MPFRSWTCHGRHQRELCQNLRSAGIIRSEAVYQVMKDTDRKLYMSSVQEVPSSAWHQQHDCPVYYVDAPYAIGMGQTISAPHMHAHVLEDMLPHLVKSSSSSSSSSDDTSRNMRLLDVGCGSGYLTACFGRWCHDAKYMGRTGRVFGIDIHSTLVDRTQRNIKSDDASLLFYDADDEDHVVSPIVRLETTNGWNGLPSEAPFDGIHVGAAAASFPKVLAMQLKLGGVMIVPIGPDGGTQSLYKVVRERLADHFHLEDFFITKLLDVRYVPLVQSPVVLAP